MPVENERKFVLQLGTNENQFQSMANRVLDIAQGYLSQNVRIRKTVTKKARHHFTFKQTINEKVIEIEKKISEADYMALVMAASSWVTKIRYVVFVGNLVWEVDFFKKNGKTYFVMAEVELPDGVLEPHDIPVFISKHLIFTVARLDSRFSSKKLSDAWYAKSLMEEIDQLLSS